MNDPKVGLALYSLMLAGFPLLFLGLGWLVDRFDRAMERRRAGSRPPAD